MTFRISQMGKGMEKFGIRRKMENNIPKIRERKGSEKMNTKIQGREGNEKTLSTIWERESEAFIPGKRREQLHLSN